MANNLILPLLVSMLLGRASCTNDGGLYTVVAPRNIRSNSDYQVSLTLHGDLESATINLRIQSSTGNDFEIGREVVLHPNQTQLVNFAVPELNMDHRYKLVAEGIAGIIFKNETELFIETKNVSVFIQTDKAKYAPNDTIKFRILLLDSLLRPVININQLNITITDPSKNCVQQWIDEKPINGVYTSEFRLPEGIDVDASGEWNINVTVGNETKSKSIDVEISDLSEFNVTIESPTHFLLGDGIIYATIRSIYPSGQHVRGKAIVSIPRQRRYWLDGRPYDFAIEKNVAKEVTIDGEGIVSFDITDDLTLSFDEFIRSQSIVLEATVMDELTGRAYSVSKEITIHARRFKVRSEKIFDEFDLQAPHKLNISITRYDDSPILVVDANKSIEIGRWTKSADDSENTVEYLQLEWDKDLELDSDGSVQLDGNHLYDGPLRVRYMNEETDLPYYSKVRSITSLPQLNLEVVTKRPTLNENLFIRVESEHPLQHFTYHVIANGKLLFAGTIHEPNSNRSVLMFNVNVGMVPKVHVIVFRIVDGEIVSAAKDIPLEDVLDNFSDESNSILFDRSPLFLKTYAPIAKAEILSEMQEYETRVYPEYDFSSTPLRKDFADSNAILFTNAHQDGSSLTFPFWRNPAFDYLGIPEGAIGPCL